MGKTVALILPAKVPVDPSKTVREKKMKFLVRQFCSVSFSSGMIILPNYPFWSFSYSSWISFYLSRIGSFAATIPTEPERLPQSFNSGFHEEGSAF